jgi:phospholipid/cholesterol/gamma-HCH transport system substrate-binding protein
MTTRRTFVKSIPASPRSAGIAVMVGLLAFALIAFNRPRVETILASGEVLNADFSQSYKLVPYQSVVKLAGVEVGTVTGVDRTAGNQAHVEMKLDDGTLDKLGTAPAANVRPTLVLGGTYYVELVRGGENGATSEGATIPVDHTTTPVELDKVISALTPSAVESVHGTVGSLERTFDKDGQRAVVDLVTTAPPTLRSSTKVLDALRGNRPATDLTVLVSGLQHTAAALTSERGRLTSILDDLATTTDALSDERGAIASTLDEAPQTLSVTRDALADLDGTLDKLRVTADDFRPSARALAPLLADLDPVLVTARPVIADARTVSRLARPLVEDLVPASVDAKSVLDDVKGPVMNRANGPLTQAVLSPWHGTGKYSGGGNDQELYKELAYFLSDTADVFKFHDHNGAHGRLMAGVGLSTAGGIIGGSLEEYLESLGLQLPAGPQEGANVGEPAPPLGSSPSSSGGSGTSLPGAGLAALQLPLVTSRSSR